MQYLKLKVIEFHWIHTLASNSPLDIEIKKLLNV